VNEADAVNESNPFRVRPEGILDQQIRLATERGEFDNLPGTGKPIAGLDQPHDDDWWIKEKLRREDVSFLPPTLALRRDVDLTREKIERAADEAEVQDLVTAINERIRALNRIASSGPPSNLYPLDLERVLSTWRSDRSSR
jgi:Domain of unknown function (DUF1992)